MRFTFTKTETLTSAEAISPDKLVKTTVERWGGVADVINDHTGGSMLKSSALSDDVGSEKDKLIIIFKDMRPDFVLSYKKNSRKHPAGFRNVENHFKLEPEPGEALPEAIEVFEKAVEK